MRAADLVLIVAIWGTFAAVSVPCALRRPHATPRPAEPLVLDTNPCSLPSSGVIPTGK